MTGIKLTQSDLDYYYMKVRGQEQDEPWMYYEQEWDDRYCGCPEFKDYEETWN